MPRVLLIGTVETKRAEMDYLAGALGRRGFAVELVDVSLGAGGQVLSSPEKLARMTERAEAAARHVAAQCSSCEVAMGLGGGTGGEIVLGALRALPAAYPKVLITTLAFDPRAALADSAITLVPTLCDIEGLNPMLRQTFENAAVMVEGLSKSTNLPQEARPNIAVTTLGATGPAGAAIAKGLDARGMDATVFHANGYGGAAFSRFVQEGGAAGVLDLNVHELGRLRLAGAHVPMPNRWRAADALPRVVLPGALNFIGLGALETVPETYRARPHYQQSGHFTHIVLTEAEMVDQAEALAAELNHAKGPCQMLSPMGGFSHEDRRGGAIEAPELRETAARVLEREARAYGVTRLPHHINAEETAAAAVDALLERMPDG